MDASPPAHERVSSTNPHQQGHGGSLDPALKKSLDAAFEKSFRQSCVPGAIAAVRTPEGTWVSTLGVANKASGKPMRADMHHRIGSITKTFTVTLLLRAAAEGRLSLDDTIDQYVKGVPNGDEITLRQMANMSSGIASYQADKQWAEEALSHPRKVWKPRELARIGIKDSPVFDPGKGWQYSNTNYELLGLVLEQVTDKPIGKLYQKEIIRPLHLRETSFPNADPALPEPYEHGYTLQGQSNGKPADATHWSPTWSWIAGAMISTVDDLLVYGRALGTGEGLLPTEQQAERLTSFLYGLQPNTPQRAYGLGLVDQRGWLGHTGEVPGYNTSLYYNAELHTTMVVEVNSDISVGNCPADEPTMSDSPHDIVCSEPADFVFGELSIKLGKPFDTKQ
ncbi:MAG TPA: serine hydrolase domain-containing protein [Rubrobacter sp.]|nr:serine hydrolase domain-containing protein [Rubrobacter sp.]